MRVVGIDLAGKTENDTGFCLMITPDKKHPLGKCETKLLKTDMEILKEIGESKPDCIAIDAPLWIPRSIGPTVAWRPCEQLLMKRGFRPLSSALPTMQMLAIVIRHLFACRRFPFPYGEGIETVHSSESPSYIVPQLENLRFPLDSFYIFQQQEVVDEWLCNNQQTSGVVFHRQNHSIR